MTPTPDETPTRSADVLDATVERLELDEELGGGDPVCWAHLLCPDCGVVLSTDAHAPTCPRAAEHSPTLAGTRSAPGPARP